MRYLRSLLLTLALCSCTTPSIRPTPTPEFPELTAYKKVVEDHLGRFWFRRIHANEEHLQLGTVKITFEIRSTGGAVTNITVISNTGGPLEESIARHAVEDLRAPPVPKAVLRKIPAGEPLVLDESFTIFQNPGR